MSAPWSFDEAVDASHSARAEQERVEGMVPYGFCRCGCGQRTKLNKQTVRKRGWVKGEPRPYVLGHNGRGRKAWNRTSEHDYRIEDRSHDTPCWIWQLRCDRAGYAITHINSYPVRACRHYYELHVGAIPEGLYIDHLCRVPACVNPDHLEPVTPAENVRRGRSTLLTPEIACVIASSTERGVDLSHRFGISPQQVCAIRKGRSWSDVTGIAA